MSEVIADIDLAHLPRAPTCLLSNALQRGIFSNKAHVSYSDNLIRILVKKELGGCYELVTKITLQKMQMSLQSTLMKNGQYFVINSSQLKKNLYRSFIKTSFEPTLKILINQQGRFAFKMHTFLATHIQFRQKKQAEKISRYVQTTYTQMMDSFGGIFQKIKFLIEPVFQKNIYQNADKLQRLDIIKNTCHFMFVKPSFIQSLGERGKDNHHNLPVQFIPEKQLQTAKFYDMKVQSQKIEQNKKFNFFIQLWQATLTLQKVQDTSLYNNFSLIKIKGMLKSNVKTPDPKPSKSQQPQEILSQISIIDIDKIQWHKIYEGGFGFLYRGYVKFFFISQNGKQKKNLHQKPIQKMLVMKTDKNIISRNFTSRVDIQKIILRSIKSKKCRYLPKFYQCSQKQHNYQNYILTEFFPLKSISNWLNNFGQFSSIFSKFAILMFTCYGIYFLHQHGIIHRDLKMSNILIDSRMVIKIIDFGQSYHKNLQQYLKSKGKDIKPGFTLPYAPPEIFSKINIYLQGLKEPTYDMYGLGFIIYEIIFGRSLLSDINQQQLKRLYLKQIQNLQSELNSQDLSSPDYNFPHGRFRSLLKQRIFLATQQLSYFGPTELLTPLINVIERCLDPKIENRPHLQWVINVIRQIYANLLDFYSF